MKTLFLFFIFIKDLGVNANNKTQNEFLHSTVDNVVNGSSGTGRVVGGTQASIDSIPHQVYVYIEAKCNKKNVCDYQVCGGSIIHPWFILTAAHCFYRDKKVPGVDVNKTQARVLGRNAWVRVGSSNSEQNGTEIQGRRSIVHGKYHKDDVDVALILLDQPVKWGPPGKAPQLILIPGPNEMKKKWDKEPCWISGWGIKKKRYYWGGLARGREMVGLTSNAASNLEPRAKNELQQAEVDILDNEECIKIFQNFSDPPHRYPEEEAKVVDQVKQVKTTTVCAIARDGGARDTCQGDSGGPLTCFEKKTKNPMLLGIVKSGRGCASPGVPGIYTRAGVSYIRKWIVKFIRKYLPKDETMAPFPEKPENEN